MISERTTNPRKVVQMKTLLFTLMAGALTVAWGADVPWLDLGDVSRSPAATADKTAGLVLAAATQSRPQTPLSAFDSMCRFWQVSNPIAVFDSHPAGCCILVR